MYHTMTLEELLMVNIVGMSHDDLRIYTGCLRVRTIERLPKKSLAFLSK